uniref:Uncharacterized protein n=1 Tax=Bionectria ochroleuca TaxID=29856 RepID=A0A8H7N9Q2_BIOOC
MKYSIFILANGLGLGIEGGSCRESSNSCIVKGYRKTETAKQADGSDTSNWELVDNISKECSKNFKCTKDKAGCSVDWDAKLVFCSVDGKNPAFGDKSTKPSSPKKPASPKKLARRKQPAKPAPKKARRNSRTRRHVGRY